MADEDSRVIVKLAMTALILILMIPGLIIEPTPVSELVGLGSIAALWGLDGEVDV